MAREKKTRPIQKTRNSYLFLVDGDCERWYLKTMKAEYRLNLTIKSELTTQKTLEEQYNQILSEAKDNVKSFWIVDLDELIRYYRGDKMQFDEFIRYKRDIETNHSNIFVIINSPCLEFWYLLHFSANTKFYPSYKELKNELKKYLVDYEKKEEYYLNQRMNIFQRLKSNLHTAFKNSANASFFDEEDPEHSISQMRTVFDELGINLS